MIRTVVIDLDGPLLDSRMRHYACYRSILNELGYAALDMERYWELKRSRVDRRVQLSLSGASDVDETFLQLWQDRIERPEYLAHDQVQPGAVEMLANWKRRNVRIVLATLRRHPEALHRQIASTGLDVFLDTIVVSSRGDGGTGKAREVRRAVPDLDPDETLWIGDTEADIEAARALGCQVWAVTCGIRTQPYLLSLAPDYLSPDLATVDLQRCGR